MVGTCGLLPGSVPVKGEERQVGSSASVAMRVKWVSGWPVGRILYPSRKSGATEENAGTNDITGRAGVGVGSPEGHFFHLTAGC